MGCGQKFVNVHAKKEARLRPTWGTPIAGSEILQVNAWNWPDANNRGLAAISVS
jgi:hypothetical protein